MYILELTDDDIDTINSIGYKYNWSESLKGLNIGINKISESEAWFIRDSIELDMEGGHSIFPMLNPSSHLYTKLLEFYNEVV